MGLTSKDIKRLASGHQKIAADISPRVYVGTYAKYNSGSIQGEWLNLDDYYDAEQFLEAARELHKDEEDPELMFQDFEGVPDWAYSESSIDPKFWDFMNATEDWDTDRQEAFQIFGDYYYGDSMADTDMLEAIEAFEERYQGQYSSVEDYAYGLVEDLGFEGITNAQFYFDVESFARDIQIEGWSYASAQDAQDNPDDYPDGPGTYDPEGEFYSEDRIEDVVDQWLDEGVIGGEQIQQYFDYEKYGRDMVLGGDIYEVNGHIFNSF